MFCRTGKKRIWSRPASGWTGSQNRRTRNAIPAAAASPMVAQAAMVVIHAPI